jgi:hypothetical protein
MKWLNALTAVLILTIPASSLAKPASTRPRPDQEVRTIIRKKAPFWLQDGELQVLLNKDASFSIGSAEGKPIKEGKWRVEQSQLKLVWINDQREKAYPVEIVNRAPVIAGAALKDGRFVVSNGH